MTVPEALKILGMKQGCKMADIKSKYRKLAMRHHPDKNKGAIEAVERMAKINEAYNICCKYYEGKQHLNSKQGWTTVTCTTTTGFAVDVSGTTFTIKFNL